ncbi:putative late blight resistance protein homolog R1C-3 [Lycium ferocissimum]|uniref:putative late blight resistance protein homolog R1C-3 n=1 Tax=Lycium ferocissimum TaxID=112874 RepID=UPI0028151A73|nr:putative late blight resistance protein homolog R1C-3 [Lycium ferocissimum]
MASDKEFMSRMIEGLLLILADEKHSPDDCGMKFMLWELKFLDSFLGLQSFAFVGECGILDFTQKMLAIWKSTVDPDSDSESNMVLPKLEFRATYSFPKISPLSANKVDDIIPPADFVMAFIDVVEENLNISPSN